MESIQVLHFKDGFILFYFGDRYPSAEVLDPYYSKHGYVIRFTNIIEDFEVIF